MNHITSFAIMGLLAGAIAGFGTRIIRPGMIFSFVSDWFKKEQSKSIMKTGKFIIPPVERFLSCVFCLTPWIAFFLDACYIVIYSPVWYLCIIGVLASVGTGNFIAETIYGLRGQE